MGRAVRCRPSQTGEGFLLKFDLAWTCLGFPCLVFGSLVLLMLDMAWLYLVVLVLVLAWLVLGCAPA